MIKITIDSLPMNGKVVAARLEKVWSGLYMNNKDIILTINVVEESLLSAMQLHSQEMGVELHGLVLVQKSYAKARPDRRRDTSGVFTEIVCNFDDQDELQRVLKPYQDRILAATYRYESAVLPFRQVLPFVPYIFAPSETALLWTTQKPLMRDRLHNYDSSLSPQYQNIHETDVAHVHNLIKSFTYPLIVKPSNLAGSLLVTRCNNKAELDACLKNTFAVIDEVFAREHRSNKPSVLIEEMMQGDMYSTDVYITHDGIISCLPLIKVTTAHAAGLTGFYGYEQICPTELSKQEVAAAFEAASSAVKALSLSASTAHVELFHTTQGWKIIEVGARIGGYRDTLYREAYGISHYYNDLAIRMGKEPKMPGETRAYAAVTKIYAKKEGIIEAIEGTEQVSKLESVIRVKNRLNPGDEALFSTNGGHHVVHIILSNSDQNKLKSDLDQVHKLLNIRTKPS